MKGCEKFNLQILLAKQIDNIVLHVRLHGVRNKEDHRVRNIFRVVDLFCKKIVWIKLRICWIHKLIF